MTKTRPQWIPVVAGLILRNDQLLLGQRPTETPHAGAWEFPGGKIEPGESPEQALHRELSEELGIEAEIGRLHLATTHHYGSVGIVLLFYEVKFWKGQPKAKHHSAIRWATPSEIKTLDLPKANSKVLNQIITGLGIEG